MFAAAADKPVLSIMCFQGYAEDSWVKPFEQKYNCAVKIAYAGTVDEMFSRWTVKLYKQCHGDCRHPGGG